MTDIYTTILKRQMRLTRYSKGLGVDYRRSVSSVDDQYLGRLRRLLDTMTERDKLAFQKNSKTTRAKKLKKLLIDWNTKQRNVLKEYMALGYSTTYDLEKDAIVRLVPGDKVNQVDKPARLIFGKTIPETATTGAIRYQKFLLDRIKGGFAAGQDVYPMIAGTPDLRLKDGAIWSRDRSALTHIGDSVMTGASDGRMTAYAEKDTRTFRWSSTLDGKTCMQCAALDQQTFGPEDGVFMWPPAHPHCRCAMVEDIPNRGGKRGALEDFELQPKNKYKTVNGEKIKIPNPDRVDPYLVDRNTSFSKWFKSTDKEFQKEWLGPSRYELYEKGNYPITKFTDPRGRVYSLADLERLND